MNFNQLFSSVNPSDYSFINNDEHHSLSVSKGTAPMFSPAFETGTPNSQSMSKGKAPMFSHALKTGTPDSLSMSKVKAPIFSPELETGATTSLSMSKGKAPMFSPGLQTATSHEGDIYGNNVNRRRKPRGRPRGSKNKSKVPVPKKGSTMKSTMLDIPSGTDIVRWVREYAQSRKVSVNVIAGSGIVTQAVVSQLMTELRPAMYWEHHRLFSLSGTCMYSPAEPDGFRCFTAMLGRMDGSVIGGEVESMLSVGPVQLTAIIANNMEFIN